LLERYALATIPYGQFLIDRGPDSVAGPASGTFLLLGNVDYDRADHTLPRMVAHGLRAAAEGEEDGAWLPLPATRGEVEQISATVSSSEQVVRLEGSQASGARVLEELPRARIAHFATHGFFADRQFTSALELDPHLFERRRFLEPYERTTIAGRSPLVLSGLVLAGANRRETGPLGLPLSDGGILTAEALAGLPLHRLELVTLSACETGLGDVAGGEGVFGLQRAFHVAGAQTVVTSLWKVDDLATQALMASFYDNLYRRRMGRLAALRAAQLSVLYGESARRQERGLVRVGLAPGAVPPAAGRAAPQLWAGWVLSGAWQ
jgi:CHAT domain-containing protein